MIHRLGRLFFWGIVFACASGGLLALQDPTRPVSVTANGGVKGASPQYVLSAIIINHSRRVALIDGRWVMEGRMLDESRVVRIESNAVLLETPEGPKRIVRKAAFVKQSVSAANE